MFASQYSSVMLSLNLHSDSLLKLSSMFDSIWSSFYIRRRLKILKVTRKESLLIFGFIFYFNPSVLFLCLMVYTTFLLYKVGTVIWCRFLINNEHVQRKPYKLANMGKYTLLKHFFVSNICFYFVWKNLNCMKINY